MGRLYKIFGITDEMYEAMKGTFKDEILIYENNLGHRQYRIWLTWWQALILKFKMAKYNLNNPAVLKLVRDI